MSVEPFTAVAMCPKCSAVAVHPWREPRYRPRGDQPVDKAIRRIGDHAIYVWGGSGSYFDDDSAQVVRQCPCGAEWGQS